MRSSGSWWSCWSSSAKAAVAIRAGPRSVRTMTLTIRMIPAAAARAAAARTTAAVGAAAADGVVTAIPRAAAAPAAAVRAVDRRVGFRPAAAAPAAARQGAAGRPAVVRAKAGGVAAAARTETPPAPPAANSAPPPARSGPARRRACHLICAPHPGPPARTKRPRPAEVLSYSRRSPHATTMTPTPQSAASPLPDSVIALQAEHGRQITPVQYALLRALQDAPGIDQVTLADKVALDTSTTADIATRLEAKGWIVRELLPRRQRALRLTPEGEAVLADMLPRVMPMYRQLLQHLAPAEQAEFLRLLRKFVHLNTPSPGDPDSGKPEV